MASKSTEAVQRRGPRGSRPEVILKASMTLFREQGFAATSIIDIGNAAGISAPALYRHFGSKDEILVAVFDYAVNAVGRRARAALRPDLPPREALDALCQSLVEVAAAEPDLLAVMTLERRSLTTDEALRLRRQDRMYREEYVHLLTAIRPDLSDAHARVLVRAAIYAVVSASFEEALVPDDEQILLMKEAMMCILLGTRNAR